MRSTTTLMKNWQFTGPDGKTITVGLPHTWNNIDGQDGGNDYWRGSCTYKTSFAAPAFDPAAQQVWLQFEGVGDSAKVSLNGTEIANHDGGFSTFRADITALLKEQNELTVIADNSKNDFVYPQKADFTFYGGIYRDVSLLVVNKNHIALGHFGDTGVKITPALKDGKADIRVETLVEGEGVLSVELLDAAGNIVATAEGADAKLHLETPHLWDGVKDPYLYTCVVRLMQDGKPVDESTLASVLLFISCYAMITLGASLVVALNDFPFTETLTSVITCISNTGPGLGAVGPAGNFSAFSPLSKLVLSLCMIIGRLEIFPILVMFSRSTWRRV